MLTESKFLTLRDKVDLHVQVKEVDSPVWLIATHGIGEHMGRHNYLMNLFARDFNILLYDLRGHGKSSGRRAYVDSFSDFYNDLDEILNMLREQYNLKRYILFGHSMGALITAGYLQKIANAENYPEKIFLSSPSISVPGLMGSFVKYAPRSIFNFLSSQPISVELGGLVDLRRLSHNPNIYRDYLEDPNNCLKIHSKLLLEMVLAMRDVFSKPLRLKCAGDCVYGTSDTIIDPDAINEYFSTIEKTIVLNPYEGAWHEIHNESESYRKNYFEFLKNSLFEILYKS